MIKLPKGVEPRWNEDGEPICDNDCPHYREFKRWASCECLRTSEFGDDVQAEVDVCRHAVRAMYRQIKGGGRG